ncbi:hypothetical protein CEXT_326901 [Caerostris extrusa]|uniref:Uncharacterized protein n=1 Tax=Caerostris extrusa TaxID=172846 RepID=A0AAV4T3H1_CAEEX|nr:hypothetical protein CEXT_326901 [Caerostris extrusa]
MLDPHESKQHHFKHMVETSITTLSTYYFNKFQPRLTVLPWYFQETSYLAEGETPLSMTLFRQSLQIVGHKQFLALFNDLVSVELFSTLLLKINV